MYDSDSANFGFSGFLKVILFTEKSTCGAG
jgi:hypothetical protein